MIRWVRWKGLVPFLIITILIAVFWFFLIDKYAETLIEKAGTSVVGAKVQLDEADVTLFPAGITLRRLQITDPDEPMKNAVEVARASFLIDALQILRKKALIKDMTVEGVRFGTPRETSGAVKKPKAEKEAPGIGTKLMDRLVLPSFEMPDPKRLLEEEELETLRLASALKTDLENKKRDWEERINRLPDKNKAAEYEKRIKELTSKKTGFKDILGAAAGLKEVKDDIERDINQITSARTDFAAEMESIKKRIGEVSKTPARDFGRLRDKYSLSPQGFANFSRILFGQRVYQLADKSLLWYGKLKPILERAKKKDGPEVVKPVRAKGRDVKFKEHNPLPDFLIRLTKASVSIKAGDIYGKVENVTSDQDVLGLPLTFDFSGENLKGMDSVRLDGSINHVKPDKVRDSAELRINGYVLKDVGLLAEKEFPVSIKNGTLDIEMDVASTGEKISSSFKGKLRSLAVSAGREDEKDALLRAMASVLGDVREINLKGEISGTLDDYSLSISSDLDDMLKGSILNQFRKQAAEWEKKLQAAIKEKTGAELKGLDEGAGALAINDKRLEGLNDELKRLLRELPSQTGGKKGIRLPF